MSNNGMDERQAEINQRMAGPPDPDSPAALRAEIERQKAEHHETFKIAVFHQEEAKRLRAVADEMAGAINEYLQMAAKVSKMRPLNQSLVRSCRARMQAAVAVHQQSTRPEEGK